MASEEEEAFLPERLCETLLVINNRVFLDEEDPRWRPLMRRYCMYDWEERLRDLIRDDPEVCCYLRAAIHEWFTADRSRIYPPDVAAELNRDARELNGWLLQRYRLAMRPSCP